MPRMIISFEMDNAAFDENMFFETAQILRGLADRMEIGIGPVTVLRDTNGNRIGQAEFYDDLEEEE